MGRLAEDMTHLVGEIQKGHADRARTIQEVKRMTAELKRGGAAMQTNLRAARAEMIRRQRRMLHGFVSGLRGTVAGLRKACADDLVGVHTAWTGAETVTLPRRGPRGGTWFDGESA